MATGNTIGSVFVRVRPKVVKGLRRKIEDEFERDLREPIGVEAETRLDPESTRKAVRQAQKEADRVGKATIKFDADYAGVNDAIKRVERELKNLERHEIEFTADKKGLNKALRELREEKLPDVSLEVTYKDDAAGRNGILRRIRELRDEAKDITVDLDVSDDGLADLERQISQAARRGESVEVSPRVSPFALAMVEGQLAVAARDRWVELKPRINRRVMADLTGAFMSIAGLNSIRTLVDQIRNIALNFDEWAVAVGTASAAIGSLVSVGTVGLGSLLSIAGDTLQVFQGIAAAPALLLSGAAVLQTWKAIWSDFGAALMDIPGALEGMPPQAQRAVGAIQELNDEVNGAVQNNFWGQMTDEVERFKNSIGPSVVRVMGNTATVMGRTASSMLDYTEALKDSGAIDEFTRNHTLAMHRVGEGAETVFKALMDMGIQGSKYLPQLGEGFRNLSNDFADFMDEAIQTGQFDQWIQNSIESIKSLGQFSKATWDTLAGITRAFENVGGAGLHEMADGMERVAAFVNRGDTQAKLEGIFRAAMDGAASAGAGFADLAKTVWEYDEAIQMALRTTGQLAGDFMTQISKLNFDVPIQGFEDLMSGLTDFVNRAGPGFQSIVNIFGRLGSIGGEVAREIAHGMNLTMGAIDGFIARIQGPLINAIHPLTRVFEDVAALGTPILFAMADSIGVLLNAFSMLPAPIQNVITLLTILGRTGVLSGLQTAMAGVGTAAARMRGTVALQTAGVTTAFQRMRVQAAAQMTMLRASMGGLAGALGGPWGIALAGAVGVLSAFAGASAEADARQAELVGTLDQVTGAMTRQAEVALYDALMREAETFSEKLQALDVDFEDAFSRMGFSVSDLTDVLKGSRSEVEAFADGLQELEDLDASGIQALMDGDFSGVSDSAAEVFDHLGLANIKATEFNTVVSRINGEFGPMAHGMGAIADRTGELGHEADEAADAVGRMSDRADGMSAPMQEAADAMQALADETSTAEQRVDALHTAMRILNGEEFTVEEQIANATKSLDSGMTEIERLAKDGGFNVSNAFNEAGEFDLSHIDAVKVSEPVQKVVKGIVGEIDVLQQKFDEGLVGDAQYATELSDLESKYNTSLESIADTLGMTSGQTKAFIDYVKETNGLTFDPKELELIYDGEASEQAKKDWEALDEAGMRINESEYLAELDANSDGIISEIERAEGMGKAFDDLLYEASLSGDMAEYNRVMDAAVAQGYMFNGKNFEATLDADGQPTEEGLALALERGYMWDGTEYVSLLKADGSQTAEEVAEAKARLSDYEDIYKASLEAGMDPAAAAALAAAVTDVEDYEGDYQALLSALETPEGRAAVEGLLGDLDNIDGKKVLATIDAEDNSKSTVTEAKREFTTLDGTISRPKILAEGADTAIGDAGRTRENLNLIQRDWTGRIKAEGAEAASGAAVNTTGLFTNFEGTYVGQLLSQGAGKARSDAEGTGASFRNVVGTYIGSLLAGGAGTAIGSALTTKGAFDSFEGTYSGTLTAVGGGAAMGAAAYARERFQAFEKTYTATLSAQGGPQAAAAINGAAAAGRIFARPYIATIREVGSAAVIGRVNAARIAATVFASRPYIARLSEIGSAQVIAAAMRAQAAATRFARTPYIARLMEMGSQQVIAAAARAGAAATRFARVYSATITERGSGAVIGAANSVYSALSRINRTVHVRFTSSGAGALSRAAAIARSNADGSLSGSRFKPGITRFDNGGVNFGPKPTTAHIAPAGSYVMYAERETGGEAFIPLAASKRNRSVAIWEETGKRLNVLADGGVSGGETVASGGDIWNVSIHGGDVGVKDLMNESRFQKRRSGRRS